MLTSLRKGAASWLAKILFALLILSFAAWGVGDYLSPEVDDAVATVGESEIGAEEFRREYSRQFNEWRRRLGGNVTPEIAAQLGLPQEVLQATVRRRLVELEAGRLGLAVGRRPGPPRHRGRPEFRRAPRRLRPRTVRAGPAHQRAERGRVRGHAPPRHLAAPGRPVGRAQCPRIAKHGRSGAPLPERDPQGGTDPGAGGHGPPGRSGRGGAARLARGQPGQLHGARIPGRHGDRARPRPVAGPGGRRSRPGAGGL